LLLVVKILPTAFRASALDLDNYKSLVRFGTYLWSQLSAARWNQFETPLGLHVVGHIKRHASSVVNWFSLIMKRISNAIPLAVSNLSISLPRTGVWDASIFLDYQVNPDFFLTERGRDRGKYTKVSANTAVGSWAIHLIFLTKYSECFGPSR
jgi:hypothetical protein